MKAGIIAAIIVLSLMAVSANAGTTSSSNCSDTGGAYMCAQGGNITWLIQTSMYRQTDHWQGYAGRVHYGTATQKPKDVNATGSYVNATNINLTIECNDPTYVNGYVAFSNTSTPPSGLVPGDLTILDQLTGNKSDSGSKTFTTISTFDLPSGSIANVPTTFSYVNETAQSSFFREGYFNQGNDLVFITQIEQGLAGYNTSFFDFQSLLVAPNRTTVKYNIFADLNFSCPIPPGGGGGSGGAPGGCIVTWQCDPWGACQPDGFQYRRCFPRFACPNMTGRFKPPTVRECSKAPREELPEVISERKIFLPGVIGNLSLNLTPGGGYILEFAVMNGTFRNNNYISIEDITYRVTTPRIYTAFANPHPYPMLLWSTGIGGWTDHGQAEAKALDWGVIPPEPLERLNPRTTAQYQFKVVPPVMQPKLVDIGISAYSGDFRVRSAIAQFNVEVHPFQVAAEWKQEGIVTLYFVVDNRGKQEKDINIEFGLNRGKSTLEAEMLGVLRLPADAVAIYGYEYRLGKAAMKADRVDATLVTKEEVLKAQYLLR